MARTGGVVRYGNIFSIDASRLSNTHLFADSFVFGVSPRNKPRVLQRLGSTQPYSRIPVKELAEQIERQGSRCCIGYVERNRFFGWRRRKLCILLENKP